MIDLSSLCYLGKPLGTTPGGLFQGSDGTRYHAKAYSRGDQARAEILACRLYEQAGLWTVRPELALNGGQPCTLSAMVPDLVVPCYLELIEHEDNRLDLARFYAVSMLVRNVDAIGPHESTIHANLMMIGRTRKLVVVDAGASFGWRGNGTFDFYLPVLGEGGHIYFDHRPNREGRIFGALFRAWPGMMPLCLAELDTLDLERAMGGLGFSHTQEGDLREIFEARRQLLVGLAQDYSEAL